MPLAHTLMTNLTRLVRQTRGLIALSVLCYQTVAKLFPSVTELGVGAGSKGLVARTLFLVIVLGGSAGSDREREILNLIAQGHPNPAIAKQLSLSTKTVGNCVSNIFTTLQVADRAQAIIRAREAGLE
jgi:ATP/maltotriose-dependent transcriptional regulator MalT